MKAAFTLLIGSLAWGAWLMDGRVTAAEPASTEALPVRLRFEWGGTSPQVWAGLLEVSDGHFERAVSLGIEADSPGTLWIDRSAVWLQRSSARAYDGFDVTVVAPPNAILTMTLQPQGGDAIPDRWEGRVRELANREQTLTLHHGGGKLAARRAPGDALKIRIDRPHLIFRPGETLAATVVCNLLAEQSHDVDMTLDWELSLARSDAVLARGAHRAVARTNAADPAPFKLDVTLPQREGAYDLRLRATAADCQPGASAVQVMVLAPASPAILAQPVRDELRVDQFQTASAGSGRLLADSGSSTGERRFGQLFRPPAVEREADARAPGLQWQAYRLQVAHLDRPHRLVIGYPADIAPQIGVSILQPNAAGQLMPVGLDAGVTAAPSGTAALPGQPGTYSVLFWPRIHDPVLLLYNLGTGRPIPVTQVAVFEMAERLPPAQPAADGGRWVGPYSHKPLFPEQFGASEALDPATQRSLDDWETFATGGQRLADYLKFAGYNSLLMGVMTDGSTIYPSRLLQPTPRYDTGLFFSTGQDLQRKDVLELLYQLFDREQLILIPELQFSTPLPELERQLSQGPPRAEGIELVGRDGQTWRATHPGDRGLAPHYNPLDPRVQQAIAAVVEEFVQRYHAHAAFRGVAFELSSLGFLQFPGLDWGYDDPTIARFEEATGIRVPAAPDRERFAARYKFLTTTASREWLKWRCGELARFHLRLARIVTSARPEARVLFAGHRILGGEQTDFETAEALKNGSSLEPSLVARGLDLANYATLPQVTVLRPGVRRGDARLLEHALEESFNSNPTLDAGFSSAALHAGSLFYEAPRECRIPEFDAASPWQPALTWLMAQTSCAGADDRKPWTHALAALDAQVVFVGGWTLPLGQDDECRALREVVRALPAVKFLAPARQPAPVTVRVASVREESWMYAVNDSAHPLSVTLQLSCPPATACRTVVRSSDVKLQPAAGPHAASQLQISLPPYAIWAACLQHPHLQVIDSRAEWPASALEELKARLDQAEHKMSLVQGQPRFDASPLPNPGFEVAASKPRELPGWNVPDEGGLGWRVDGENPRSGRSALRLTARDRRAALLSPHLPLADSRFLTMSLWLRTDRPRAPVRLAFEAESDQQPQAQEATVEVGPQWQRYLFRVRNLPPRVSQHAHVRVELLEAGDLWIDDVEIHLQRFTPDDVRQLTKNLSAARLAWDEQRYADCQRLLDGYWGCFLVDETDTAPLAEGGSSQVGSRLRGFLRRK